MRHWFTTACLTAAGVLMLVAASGTENADRPAAPAEVNVFQGDSVLPVRMLWSEEPTAAAQQTSSLPTNATGEDCPPIIEFGVTRDIVAPHFDSVRGVTEIYVRDGANERVIRHDIDAALNHTETPIPANTGIVWIAEDLDRDGEIELVGQHGADMSIYSSPDWLLRQQFYWAGMYVEMTPTVVNIDDDPYLEIYATPNGLDGSARAVIVKYDADADSFAVIADIAAPTMTAGPAAIGDFDEDGRVEFISGNISTYSLFEWQESTLAYIGDVGGPYYGFCAVACRPKPDGVLHALLGHSPAGAERGYRYQLLAPLADNVFDVVRVFEELTGWAGGHRCSANDADCDGLDELVMHFYPIPDAVHEWDVVSGDFLEACSWDHEVYGTAIRRYAVDLNQDARPEWGAVNEDDIFRAYADPDCVECDSLGLCSPPDSDCYCSCLADPECDGVSSVLDVVRAVDVAFRSVPAEADPFAQCPYERTDADCSGFTNVLDVVHLVNVAFRGADQSLEYCDPCAP